MGWFSECTAGFAKYILFLFNFIILVAAIILIAFAVKLKTQNGGIDLMSVGTFSIIVAVLIALIAFFGCCGAIKENSCMLTTYAAICLTLFIIQLVLGILAFVAVKNGSKELDDEIHHILDNLYTNYTKKDDAIAVDAIQRNLECCGRNGPFDPMVQNGTALLINSCCAPDTNVCTAINAYKKNCYDEMSNWIASSVKGIGIVAIVFGAVELLSAIFACYVKHTRN
ncbi:leukocyte surface antigen CD53 [Leptinotarsa decemlineata]|uniref:leukocyte surface antigen CD53 n=1 Tax=Leptinotarsa decemlineata TaxID=7539 RepID=UPI000C252F19|nr:leukocyte surface antigen CD53-like [Leptinotarsa decemlineata]